MENFKFPADIPYFSRLGYLSLFTVLDVPAASISNKVVVKGLCGTGVTVERVTSSNIFLFRRDLLLPGGWAPTPCCTNIIELVTI